VIQLFAIAIALWAGAAGPPSIPGRTPVVVELFTSEGCSDCPPADMLLKTLETEQPIPGIEVIPLGFHVDYWNDLGWRDRFSEHAFTERQVKYVDSLRLESPYTPQIIVDGKIDVVGNEVKKVLHAIQERAKAAKANVSLKNAGPGAVDVSIDHAADDADVMLALTETSLSTNVPAGENRGRELHHTAVVRSLTRMGTTKDGAFHAQFRLALHSDWHRENLRAVVFLQRTNGEILGAATVPLR